MLLFGSTRFVQDYGRRGDVRILYNLHRGLPPLCGLGAFGCFSNRASRFACYLFVLSSRAKYSSIA